MKRVHVIVLALAGIFLAMSASVNPTDATGAAPAVQAPRPSASFAWPGPVETAFKQKYPKATVKAVIKETEAGKTVYEVESVDNGRRRNVDYNADGTIIRYEEELTEAEVPAVVRAAVKARYPGAAINLWERLYTTRDNSANYECQLSGAGVAEAILTPDGKWVSPKAGK
jgi:hypothetical protein